MSKKFINPADFILPLNINGMDGRMLRIVNDNNRHKRRELLFIYDLGSNLEKWWGLAVVLKNYGNVTMIDLPGMGGMDSFYTIGLRPTIDNMADYIAAVIKLRFKRKRITLVGVGFGFVLITRMLQRNPDLNDKVNILVCLNGYAHKDDFVMKQADRLLFKLYSLVGSTPLVSAVIKLVANNNLALKLRYPLSKIEVTKKGPSQQFIWRFKLDLIKATDVRTKMFINLQLMKLDNCASRLNKPMWHITTSSLGKNLSLKLVEQHFKVIFPSYHQLPTKTRARMPLILTDAKLAIKLLPARVRRELRTAA